MTEARRDHSDEPKATTPQTRRDGIKLQEIINSVDPQLFERMQKALRRLSKKVLGDEATMWAQQVPCRPPGRLHKRQRQAMICWYCHHWSERAGTIAEPPVDTDTTLYDSADDYWWDWS
jgi:hypothetical protein